MKRFVLIAVLILSSIGGARAMDAMTVGELTGGAIAGGFAVYKLIKGAGVDGILYAAGYEAAVLGIQQAPAADQQAIARSAVRAAVLISKWLNDNQDQNAQAFSDFIATQFSGDPWILGMLQSIAPTVERYIPVATQYLSPKVIEYLGKLIAGIRDGAGTLLDNPMVKVKAKYTTKNQQDHELKKMKVRREIGWFVPSVEEKK